VNVNGGRLLFTGSATANSSELVGTINPGTDVSSIIEVQTRPAGVQLRARRQRPGGRRERPTRFVGTGLPLTETGPNRLVFTNNPGGLTNAVLPQGVVTSTGLIDLATYGSAPRARRSSRCRRPRTSPATSTWPARRATSGSRRPPR